MSRINAVWIRSNGLVFNESKKMHYEYSTTQLLDWINIFEFCKKKNIFEFEVLRKIYFKKYYD